VSSGSTLKLLRAQEHLARLQEQVSIFFESEPYYFVVEHNTDSREHNAYVRLVGRAPFNQWALIVGDIVHNMRSALDNAVYEIGVRESGEDVPPGSKVLAMPIFDDAKGYEQRGRWRIESLGDEARTIIEAIQPYRHPNGVHGSGLWALHEIDNADKHRILQVVATVPMAGNVHMSNLVAGTECTVNWHLGLIGDDTPFFTSRTAVPSPDVQMVGMPILQVAIKRVEVEDRESFCILMPYLGGLLEEAAQVVGLLSRIPSQGGELLASAEAHVVHDWNPPDASAGAAS
jgi:hypothetical protein